MLPLKSVYVGLSVGFSLVFVLLCIFEFAILPAIDACCTVDACKYANEAVKEGIRGTFGAEQSLITLLVLYACAWASLFVYRRGWLLEYAYIPMSMNIVTYGLGCGVIGNLMNSNWRAGCTEDHPVPIVKAIYTLGFCIGVVNTIVILLVINCLFHKKEVVSFTPLQRPDTIPLTPTDDDYNIMSDRL